MIFERCGQKMKTTTILSIITLMIVLAACTNQAPASAPETNNSVQLKEACIRVTAPLSGPYAYYGTQVQKGLDLAFEAEQETLSEQGMTLNLMFDDNTGNKAQAVTSFTKFVAECDPTIIISTNTPLSQPLIPLAEENKVNLLALVTGAKDFAVGNDYVFRDAIMSYQEGTALGKYMQSKQINKVATLVVNDDYGLSAADGVKEIMKDNVVQMEKFENAALDMRTEILKIKASGAEAVVIAGREKNILLGVHQLLENGFSQEQIFTIDSFESPTVLNELGELANGITFTTVYVDPENPQSKAFQNNFKAKYGEEPGIYAIDAYAAGQYIVQSMVDCGTSAEEVNSCLKTKEFNTIKGTLGFDEKHDATISIGIYKMENGSKMLISRG
ncbi:MAG: ABC transporter substrate-binding protein [Candidatus Woesearchaeota archaeon]